MEGEVGEEREGSTSFTVKPSVCLNPNSGRDEDLQEPVQ